MAVTPRKNLAARRAARNAKAKAAKPRNLGERGKTPGAKTKTSATVPKGSNSSALKKKDYQEKKGGSGERAKKQRTEATKRKLKKGGTVRPTKGARALLAEKGAKKVATKAAVGKLAARAVPGLGTALLAKDAYKAIKKDNKISKATKGRPKGKGGQMKRGRKK